MSAVEVKRVSRDVTLSQPIITRRYRIARFAENSSACGSYGSRPFHDTLPPDVVLYTCQRLGNKFTQKLHETTESVLVV